MLERIFRFDHRESLWTDIYIQSAVEAIAEVKTSGFEDRSLAFERTVRVIRGLL
jgi:hypothetical protein